MVADLLLALLSLARPVASSCFLVAFSSYHRRDLADCDAVHAESSAQSTQSTLMGLVVQLPVSSQ